MIRFDQVIKSYNGRPVVNELSLEITEQEVFVLLGESGSGKTTTLKMINRLIDPDSGQLFLGGINTLELDKSALRKKTGYVMQYYGLFPHYTVGGNIAVVPELLGWEKRRTDKRAAELLEIFSLEPGRFLHKYPHELSGGQQQRIGMIRALMTSPSILLMDEPLGALDPVTRASIRKEFKTLDELKNKTIVMVTHDIQEAFMLADRIGLMQEGRLIQVGKPIDFLLKPASEHVTAFFSNQYFQLMLQSIKYSDLEALLPGTRNEVPEIVKIPLRLFSDRDSSVSDLLELTGTGRMGRLQFGRQGDRKENGTINNPVFTAEILMNAFFTHTRALADQPDLHHR